MNAANLKKVGLDVLEDMRTAEIESAINIIEWGRWSRGGMPDNRPAIGGTPDITDDEALRIDRQVAKLGKTVPRSQFVIKQIYIYNRGVNELAKKLGISSRKVMEYRDQGLNIIYGALFCSEENT